MSPGAIRRKPVARAGTDGGVRNRKTVDLFARAIFDAVYRSSGSFPDRKLKSFRFENTFLSLTAPSLFFSTPAARVYYYVIIIIRESSAYDKSNGTLQHDTTTPPSPT